MGSIILGLLKTIQTWLPQPSSFYSATSYSLRQFSPRLFQNLNSLDLKGWRREQLRSLTTCWRSLLLGSLLVLQEIFSFVKLLPPPPQQRLLQLPQLQQLHPLLLEDIKLRKNSKIVLLVSE